MQNWAYSHKYELSGKTVIFLFLVYYYLGSGILTTSSLMIRQSCYFFKLIISSAKC